MAADNCSISRPDPARSSSLAPPTSLPAQWADGIIVVVAEFTKSVLRESWSLCGQFVNWGAQHAVSVLAPGYRAATRSSAAPSAQPLSFVGQGSPDGRLASVRRLGSLSSPPVDASQGRLLLDRSHYAAHQGQPTPRNRASPGLVYEAKLAILAMIDAAALSLRLCLRRPAASCARCAVRAALCCSGRRATHAIAAAQSVDKSGGSDSAGAASQACEPLHPMSDAASSGAAPDRTSSGSTTRVLISSICGCPATEHQVRTVDGYVLTLLRIPRIEATRTVFFQHGLIDTAAAWVTTGSVFSLAARAHQQGFDVFLGNLRGTDDAMEANGIVLGDCVGESFNGGEGSASAPRPRPRPPRLQHDRLLPRDGPFWDYSVDDHALDVLAHVTRIRAIKAEERPLRDAMRAQREAAVRSAEDTRRRWRDQSLHPQQQLLQQRQGSASPSPVFLRSPAATSEHNNLRVDVPQASGAPISGNPPASPTAFAAGDTDVARAAASAAADDVQIMGVGHSMGSCVLMLYTMAPHWLSRLVLLSPAGLHRHVALSQRAALFLVYFGGLVSGSRPFPQRSSTAQRLTALFLQDLKRLQGTRDFLSVLATRMFGGEAHAFAFQHVSFPEYPLGGTSCRVVRHGTQTVLNGDFTCFDYGATENTRRYGFPRAPSYRTDFALLAEAGVPLHVVAGGKDGVIPLPNIRLQYLLLRAVAPALATLKVFPDASHLDFTIGLSDELITYVLAQLQVGAGSGVAAAGEGKDVAHVAEVDLDDDGIDGRLLSDVLPCDAQDLAAVTGEALRRQAARQARPRESPRESLLAWQPAALCAREHPWLASWTHFEKAFAALDAQAAAMGLAQQREGPSLSPVK